MIGVITMVQCDNLFVLWEDGTETNEQGSYDLQAHDQVIWSEECQAVVLYLEDRISSALQWADRCEEGSIEHEMAMREFLSLVE